MQATKEDLPKVKTIGESNAMHIEVLVIASLPHSLIKIITPLRIDKTIVSSSTQIGTKLQALLIPGSSQTKQQQVIAPIINIGNVPTFSIIVNDSQACAKTIE